ncbi:hypothetical protein Rleg4DRAFT_2289 [Rhizobium leguminosarum bv. trifolii WSM2297]|uniref:Uncharacterized protein n=1 Tax=Rhizobium leguminosarum bv. trifolii WSM2297 TaxID=754762 RepID=J0KST9_RHILT|nr:hypothetical protein [Rhizobium leguminosarum]EJC80654.1 hypothetical protein Rleg4DRAFT_2289 [Rhizobium leguminosarum bv. trifolii WSM2297]
MLYLIPALFVITCAIFVGRYYAIKAGLAQTILDDAIARKLSTSPLNLEVMRLREQNAVMRNLLLDMVENEASVETDRPKTEQARAFSARTLRRREIFGEAVFVLEQSERPQASNQNLKIPG